MRRKRRGGWAWSLQLPGVIGPGAPSCARRSLPARDACGHPTTRVRCYAPMHDRSDDEVESGFPHRESLTAVFSAVARRGEWLPPEELRVVASFGAAKLDFTEALLAPGVTEIHAFALFGSVELLVPPDLHVELDARRLAAPRRGAAT